MRIRLLVIVTLTVLGLVAGPLSVARVHAAQTGLVCLADVTTAPSPPSTPCNPLSPPIFDGPVTNPNQQIRIGIYINESAGLIAFDVILKANSSVLKPAGIDFSGTIMSGVLIVAECLGLANQTASACSSVDTVDTLDLAAGTLSPTASPSTGLLFTAIYNITGTSSKPTTIGFQTGCTNTSVSGGVCVTFANGGLNPDPETVVGASFNNTIPIPYLTVSPNATSLGPMVVGATARLRLTLTGKLGWNNQFCSCTAALETITDPSIHVRLNTTLVTMPMSNVTFVAANVTGTLAGNYSLTFTAQYLSYDLQNLAPETLVAHIMVNVDITDFAVSATPTSVTILDGNPSTSTIAVSSLNGFTGTVSLTITISPSVGMNCSLNSTSVTLGTVGFAALSCTGSLGSHRVTVTGNGSGVSRTATVTFSGEDFSVTANSPSVTSAVAAQAATNIAISALSGFSGTVALSDTISPATGPSCSLSPTNISLNSSVTSATSTISCAEATVGNFTVTVSGTGSGITHSATVVYMIQDFAVYLNSTSINLQTGSSKSINLTITGLNGFASQVNIGYSLPAGVTGVKISLGQQIVTVPGTDLLKLTGVFAGSYTVNVTVTYAGQSHKEQVQVAVTTAPGGASTLFGLSPAIFYSIVGVVGAIIIASLVVVWRRAQRKLVAASTTGSKGPVRKKNQ